MRLRNHMEDFFPILDDKPKSYPQKWSHGLRHMIFFFLNEAFVWKMFEKALCVAGGGLWIAGAEKASKARQAESPRASGSSPVRRAPLSQAEPSNWCPLRHSADSTTTYRAWKHKRVWPNLSGPERQTTRTELPLGGPFSKLPTS